MPSVRDIMTPRPLVLEPDTLIDDVLRLAMAHDVCHVPVVENGSLVGMLCLCDLDGSGPGAVAQDYMTAPAVAVGPHEPLERVTDVMRTHRVGSVAVVVEDELVGIVTRDDLRRAQIPIEGFSLLPCAACGGHHHVWKGGDDVPLCIDCRDRARDPAGEEGTVD